MTFSSPSCQSFTFPVKGGLVMEFTMAQFWSSGVGSQESTIVDLEVFTLLINTPIFIRMLLFFCENSHHKYNFSVT